MYILNPDIVEFYFLIQFGSLDLLIKNFDLLRFVFITDAFPFFIIYDFFFSASVLMPFFLLFDIWTKFPLLFFLSWLNVCQCFLKIVINICSHIFNNAKYETIYWLLSLLDDEISVHQPFSYHEKIFYF